MSGYPPLSWMYLGLSRFGSGSLSKVGIRGLIMAVPILVKALDFAMNSVNAPIPLVVPSRMSGRAIYLDVVFAGLVWSSFLTQKLETGNHNQLPYSEISKNRDRNWLKPV